MTSPLLDAYRAFAAQQTFSRHQPATLYDPIRYAMAGAGKGVRPMLLLLTHALNGQPIEAALPAAYAVELFHNFTLIHDDIMDAATLRRGKAAVHVEYGGAAAILAGDAMLIHTYGYLIDAYPGALGAELLATFQPMAVALCEGQQRDMDMEAGQEADYEDYLAMIHGKTGVLITASMTMGALIAGFSTEDVSAIREAGSLAGRAFQIQDDVLDTFRTSAETGKAEYGDVVRGKQSAPYMKAITAANDSQRQLLSELYALSIAERSVRLQEILDLYKELDVERTLSEEVIELSNSASKLLSSIDGEPTAKNKLIDFTKRLAQRQR